VFELAKMHTVKYVCNVRYNSENRPFDDVEVIPFSSGILHQRIRTRLELYDKYISLKNREFAKVIRISIEDFRPNVIHCQFGYESLKMFDNYYNLETPFIIQFQGYGASQKLKLKTYQRKMASIICRENVFPIFVCEHLKNNLEKVGISTDGGMILHSNTDINFFKRTSHSHSPKPHRFLQISSFREKKGHQYTLRAFNIFLTRNAGIQAKLTFAGMKDGEYSRIRGLVDDLGLSDHVEFVGETTRQETKRLLEKCHTLLLHSITAKDGDQEGIPNVLMEAMAMELPVVSTYHAGIPELVEEGINGYLVREKDIQSYAARLEDIMSWGYVPINREKVARDFEMHKNIKKLNTYYDKILSHLDTKETN